jgi:YHS domain-containing protein
MTFLLRFLLFITAFFLLRRLLTRLFGKKPGSSQKRTEPQAGPRQEISGHTVKDPQCGTYVATSIAVPLQLKGKTYHFCSTQCRDRYLGDSGESKHSVA